MSHKRWLLVTGFVIAFYGPMLTLATVETLAEPARLVLDLLSWPLDGAQTFADPSMRFLAALSGGFLVGWGVMVWCLRAWVYDVAPEAVRRTVVIGALSWFVFDSVGSVLSANPSNVFFNILFLLLAIGPMWIPERQARTQPA